MNTPAATRPSPMRSRWRCSSTGTRGGHGSGERRARAFDRLFADLRAGGIGDLDPVRPRRPRPCRPARPLTASPTVGPVNVVAARGLVKTYGSGRAERRVLDGADIEAGAGELVAVVGRSGSGKSTLLQLLGALDRPDSGTIEVAGRRLDGRPERELTRLRRDRIGFVFQFFHLLPELTGEENVLLP